MGDAAHTRARGKIAVVLVTVAVFAAMTLMAVALALLPAMIVHGAPLRAGDPSVPALIGLVARGATLAALAAGMGFAIATLGRNTAAALGVGFAYIVVLENILGNSLRGWRRWLLLGNAIVFVAGNSDNADVPGRSVAGAGLFLAAVAGALLIGAAAAFRSTRPRVIAAPGYNAVCRARSAPGSPRCRIPTSRTRSWCSAARARRVPSVHARSSASSVWPGVTTNVELRRRRRPHLGDMVAYRRDRAGSEPLLANRAPTAR